MSNKFTEQDSFNFIIGSLNCDRINLSMEEVTSTWFRRGLLNPHADGHFNAFGKIINNLVPSDFFPGKISGLKSIQDTESALYWLKDLHKTIAEPITKNIAFDDGIDRLTIGKYRLVPTNAVTKPSVPPALIPAAMHLWLLEYARLHEQVKDKVSNPYGLTKELALEVYRKVDEIPLFFAAVQPMGSINARLGRLVESAFRMKWWLPVRFYHLKSDSYQKFIQALNKYELEKLPAIIDNASKLRA